MSDRSLNEHLYRVEAVHRGDLQDGWQWTDNTVDIRQQGSRQAMCVSGDFLLIGGYETVRGALERLPE